MAAVSPSVAPGVAAERPGERRSTARMQSAERVLDVRLAHVCFVRPDPTLLDRAPGPSNAGGSGAFHLELGAGGRNKRSCSWKLLRFTRAAKERFDPLDERAGWDGVLTGLRTKDQRMFPPNSKTSNALKSTKTEARGLRRHYSSRSTVIDVGLLLLIATMSCGHAETTR